MITRINGRPVLSYNFSAGDRLPAEKRTHLMKGKGRQHRVPKDIFQGTIRSLDLGIQHCSTATVTA